MFSQWGEVCNRVPDSVGLGSAIVKYKDFTVQESLTIFSVTMQLSSPRCCISV